MPVAHTVCTSAIRSPAELRTLVSLTVDGQRQRNAFTAAERALSSLVAGDAARARLNARKAAELDQIGALAQLPGAVEAIAVDLDAGGTVSARARARLRAAVPPGPLEAVVDALELRTPGYAAPHG